MSQTKDPKEYLSEESLEALDESIGAKMAVFYPEEHQALRIKHDAQLHEFNKFDMLLRLKKGQLKELKESGLFTKIFQRHQLKMKTESLEKEIEQTTLIIDSILEETGKLYREMVDLEKKINEFKKEIKKYGLTVEDIKQEYYRLELKLINKKKREEAAAEMTKSEPQTETIAQPEA